MNNNDVLRSVRFALDISETTIAKIIKLTGFDVQKTDLINMMKKEDEPDYAYCTDEILNAFLDGLIIQRRGPMPAASSQEAAAPLRMDNNVVLKKLRIAFELKEDDILEIIDSTGFSVSRPEVNALFRKPGHKNYRGCGDQLLRYFMKGLSIRLREAK